MPRAARKQAAEPEPEETEAEQTSTLELEAKHAAVRVGGPLTRYPLCFSSDDATLLCPSGDTVKLYAVSTGERVGELAGHTSDVTAVLRHPADALKALTASLDGTVRCWDLESRECVRTWSAGAPILHMVVPAAPGQALTSVYLNVNPKVLNADGRGACRVVCLDLDSGRPLVLYKARSCSALAVSPRGDYVVSLSNRTLSCWSVRRQELVKHRHARALTTVAFHPSDPFLATGDESGKIVLWHNFVHSDTSKVVSSTLHWHAHAVTALAFTDDGAYMMSGGEEAVLVLWQLQSEHRQFLPRLGAPIRGIEVSPSGRRYALRCGDNAVRVVDAITSRAERTIRGLQAHSTARPGSAGSVAGPLIMRPSVEPRGDLLVLPAGPGSLQFYDVFGDRHVSEHEVIPRNFVSRIDHERQTPTRVEHVAFSRDGAWMATVERRPVAADAGHRGTALKLWRFDRSAQQYALNTRVNDPHDGDVTALEFHPSGDLLLTASADSRFKLWKATEVAAEVTLAQQAAGGRKGGDAAAAAAAAAADQPRHTWGCQSVGTYRPYGVSDAAFSHDGSLLAVAYGQVLTLWDPATLELRQTLVYPGPEEPLRRVVFCRGSPFVVAASARAVYVWNLLTLSLWWSYSLPVAGLAADPRSSRFAVAVRHDQRRAQGSDAADEANPAAPVPYVLEFDPASATPVRAVQADDLMVGRAHAPVAYAPPRAKEGAASSLVYVASDRSLVRLDPESDAAGEDAEEAAGEQAQEAAAAAAAKQRASVSSVFGRGGTGGAPRPAKEAARPAPAAARVAAADELFAGASHAAPSLDAAFDSLVRSVVTEKREEADAGVVAAAKPDAEAKADAEAAKRRRSHKKKAGAGQVTAAAMDAWSADRDADLVGGTAAGGGGFVSQMLKRRRGAAAAAAAWSDSEDEDDDAKEDAAPNRKRQKKAAAADSDEDDDEASGARAASKKAGTSQKKKKKTAAAATPRRSRRRA